MRSHLAFPILPLAVLALSLVLFGSKCADSSEQQLDREANAYSFSGQPLYSAEPTEAVLARLAEKRAAFEVNPTDLDALIWYGRFVAYSGDYEGAIKVYSDGIQLNPNDPRLYRHRGHRYISVRKLDEAIEDFEMAAKLIEGQPNEIEPDGMPNAQNIPVSTLHGNIWYHLGLAYYLKHDYENALRGFSNGLATSNNDDNVVSTVHWIYMINRLMGREDDANSALDRISPDMDIIENFAYYHLDLFYKGEMAEEELRGEGPANDAILYGIANWNRYNEDLATAEQKLKEITSSSSWASFGFIAAEADLHLGL